MRGILGLLCLLLLVTVSFLGGAFVYKHRAGILDLLGLRDKAVQEAPEEGHAFSNLYNIRTETVELPFKTSREGAIAAADGFILLADRSGRFWTLSGGLQARQLDIQAPVNYEVFESDPQVQEDVRDSQFEIDRYHTRFGLKDILLERAGDGYELYATHHFWNVEERCITFRVSSTRVVDAVLDPGYSGPSPQWKTVFESRPCLPLTIDGAYIWLEEAGGRALMLSDGELLVTVGDHGYTGIGAGPGLAQDPDALYGKTIRIDVTGGAHTVFTTGHRNPQGLTQTSSGEVFLTEHGPTGGDELNLLRQGSNYGWPLVSYGRGCTGNDCADDDGLDMRNPINIRIGDHPEYQKPVFSWVPSIGISNLISVRGTLFERWKDDLLVASLKQRTVFRVRIAEGRAVLVEPVLEIPYKIRDIAELDDGSIAILTEGEYLVTMRPDRSRKQQIIAGCAACHTQVSGEGHGIGPNLWNVVGREVASAESYQYSAALRRKSELVWTPATLRQFLRDGQAFAPGNAMAQPPLTDPADVDAVVEFLQNLRSE